MGDLLTRRAALATTARAALAVAAGSGVAMAAPVATTVSADEMLAAWRALHPDVKRVFRLMVFAETEGDEELSELWVSYLLQGQRTAELRAVYDARTEAWKVEHGDPFDGDNRTEERWEAWKAACDSWGAEYVALSESGSEEQRLAEAIQAKSAEKLSGIALS
jgi:hypothetical protein